MKNYTKTMSKKAQKPSYAVPVILASMIAFLMIYLIMVYPEERAALLGQNITKTNVSPLGAGTEILYSSGEVLEIGTARGYSELKFNMDPVNLSYPAVPKTVDESKNTKIKASIVSSDKLNLNANNINLENTKEVYVLINVSSLKGNPKVVIFYNQTKFYERDAVAGETIVPIPADLLQINNPLSVQLKHTGAIWETQEITADIAAVQVFYSPILPINNQTVWIGELKGNTVKITLNVTEIVGDGNLIVKVNDKIIYAGIPELNKITTIESRLEDSTLQVGNNFFTFEAEKGSSYKIKRAVLELVAETEPAASKTYSFDITREKLYGNNTIKLAIKVDRVIQSGYLYFKIQPYSDTYYFTTDELAAGAWSYTTLSKAKLKEFGNKIFVNSPDGRFRVAGFMIVLVNQTT